MAGVQYVLLFGFDSWVVTSCILRVMGVFHNLSARGISGWIMWCRNGHWEYPPIGEA